MENEDEHQRCEERENKSCSEKSLKHKRIKKEKKDKSRKFSSSDSSSPEPDICTPADLYQFLRPDVKAEKDKRRESSSSDSSSSESDSSMLDRLFRPAVKAKKDKRRKFSSSDSSYSSESDMFMPDEFEFDSSYVVCSCCHEHDNEGIIECSMCFRRYHNNCHIPIVELSDYENIKVTWTCTMCYDIDSISTDFGKDTDYASVDEGTIGRKIANRILMELYCNDYESVHFRYCPNEYVFPLYYQHIVRPMSLETVKELLLTNENYNITYFLEDVKLIFVNAMAYYSITDPYFETSRRYLYYLDSMYHSWVAYPLSVNFRNIHPEWQPFH